MQFINNAQKYNTVIIKNTFILLTANEISEEFAIYQLLSLIDIFLNYNQILLHPKSRNLITFAISISLFKYCILLQKAINSIAQFIWIIIRILHRLILEIYQSFINNIYIKELKSIYQNQLIRNSMKKAIIEYFQNINIILIECKLAEITVVIIKLQ